MAEQAKTLIILRHGTAAEWKAKNPVLALGEDGIETDTKRRKNGDGKTPWNNLEYSAGSKPATATAWGDITGTLSSQKDLKTLIDSKESTANKAKPGGYAPLDEDGKVPAVHVAVDMSRIDQHIAASDTAHNIPGQINNAVAPVAQALEAEKTNRANGDNAVQTNLNNHAGDGNAHNIPGQINNALAAKVSFPRLTVGHGNIDHPSLNERTLVFGSDSDVEGGGIADHPGVRLRSRMLSGWGSGQLVMDVSTGWPNEPEVYFNDKNVFEVGRGHMRIKQSDGSYLDVLTRLNRAPTVNMANFSAPGTFNFTVPANVYEIFVYGCGGGGGGGGGVTTKAGSGGGAGGYCYREKIFVSPGQVLRVGVGAGGFGGSQNGNGSAGGSSGIQNSDGGNILVLGGGVGGFANAGNHVIPSGGVVSGGTRACNGESGGIPIHIADNSPQNIGGEGGSNMYGRGGRGNAYYRIGGDGGGYGAGGGGGAVNAMGGIGTGGFISIEWLVA